MANLGAIGVCHYIPSIQIIDGAMPVTTVVGNTNMEFRLMGVADNSQAPNQVIVPVSAKHLTPISYKRYLPNWALDYRSYFPNTWFYHIGSGIYTSNSSRNYIFPTAGIPVNGAISGKTKVRTVEGTTVTVTLVPNVTVDLFYVPTKSYVTSTKSDSSGNYTFIGLDPTATEAYRVVATYPDGASYDLSAHGRITAIAIDDGSPVTPPPTTPSATVMLMHMEGVDGGTVFTDSMGNSASRNGTGVTTTTAQKKFGTSSATGFTSDYINVGSTFLDGSFGVYAWFYAGPGAGTSSHSIVNLPGNHELYIRSGVLAFYAGPMSSNIIVGTTSVPLGQWNFAALEREGSNLILTLNGNIEGNASYSTGIQSGQTQIGAYGSSEYFGAGGYIDEVMIRKGSTLYGGLGFTPPTAAFTSP